MIITEMKPEELEETISVALVCFGEKLRAEARQDFGASFADYPLRPATFIAQENGRVVGVIQSVTGYIGLNLRGFSWLCVLPAFRKKGIGKKLLAHAENHAIENHFRGAAGSFILDADIDPDWYRAQGYQGDTLLHDGAPLLVKHYVPAGK